MDSSVSPGSIVQDVAGEMVDDNASEWFQKPGTDSSNDQVLRPAKEAVQGHSYFRNKLGLGSKNKRADSKIASTRTALEQQITDYERDSDSFSELRQQAAENITQANGFHETYQKDRTTGGKKIGRYAQSFVKSFADFLSVYSGIVELLKGAGQTYGAVAYETLSIFFIIVVNKTGNDSKIADLLSELRKSFPQLDDWVNIYPTLSMKMLVAEVYQQVITFARNTSKYFTHFSTRLWMAIGKPPSIGIDQTVATIHGKLAEVNSEAMIQLHKRSQKIHNTVEDNNVRIKELKSSNHALERSNLVLVSALERLEAQHQKFVQEVELKDQQDDKQRLEIFKEALGLTYPCSESDLEACKKSQTNAFAKLPSNRRSPKVEYTQMSPELLSTSEAYRQWQASTQSCLFFLSGRTASEGRNSRGDTHSWLSPATTYVAEEMRKQGRMVAYYCCHPDLRAETHAGKDILSTIIYQMLEWRPDVLRRRHQQFRSMVQSPAWQGQEEESAAVEVMFRLVGEILAEIKDLGEVVVILDRVDLCSWKLHRVMKALVGLVLDGSWHIKIMTTARDYWDVEEVDETALGRVLVHQDWDQRQLTPQEMRRGLHSPH